MRIRTSGRSLVAAIALAMAACGGGKSSTPTNPSNNNTGNTTTITIPSGDGYGSTFSPGNVTVNAGATVVWANRDSLTHTTTSDTNLWNGSMNPGGEFSRTFTTAGSFNYKCTLHPGMAGTITVQ